MRGSNEVTAGFAPDAIGLLEAARLEAGRLDHEYVGTEHLLLALTGPSGGPGRRMLEACGLDLHLVRLAVEGVVQRGNCGQTHDGALPFTSRTQRSFDLAWESARELGGPPVGAAHLILGLLREGKNIAAQVLLDRGLSLERATTEAGRLPR
jgi:ATP-dependent Clp protease ATP-binding subunit ClpA